MVASLPDLWTEPDQIVLVDLHFTLSSFNAFFPVRRLCLSRYLSSSNTFNLLISPPRNNCRHSFSSNVFCLSYWRFLPLWAALICDLCLRSFRCCTYSFTNFGSTANLVAKWSISVSVCRFPLLNSFIILALGCQASGNNSSQEAEESQASESDTQMTDALWMIY